MTSLGFVPIDSPSMFGRKCMYDIPRCSSENSLRIETESPGINRYKKNNLRRANSSTFSLSSLVSLDSRETPTPDFYHKDNLELNTNLFRNIVNSFYDLPFDDYNLSEILVIYQSEIIKLILCNNKKLSKYDIAIIHSLTNYIQETLTFTNDDNSFDKEEFLLKKIIERIKPEIEDTII